MRLGKRCGLQIELALNLPFGLRARGRMECYCEESSSSSEENVDKEGIGNQVEEDMETFVFHVGDVAVVGVDGGFYALDELQHPDGKGILTKPNGIFIETEWRNGIIYGRFIAVSVREKRMIGVYTISNNVVESAYPISNTQRNQMIQSGYFTWEGDVLDGKPCGWGKLLSRKSKVIYEGFMIDQSTVCYGRINRYDKELDYEGTICASAAHGVGKLIAPSGEIVYEGGFFRGSTQYARSTAFPEKTPELEGMHTLLEELSIGDDSCTDVAQFTLSGFALLRSVEIGENCFQRRHSNLNYRCDSMHAFFVNLQSLESLVIGKDCFCEFSVCELRGLPVLRTLSIGENTDTFGCFINCFEFVLEGGRFRRGVRNRHAGTGGVVSGHELLHATQYRDAEGYSIFRPFFRRLARTGPDAPERPVSHRQHGKGVHQIQRPTLRLQQLRGVGEFHRCFLFTS